MTDSQVSGRSGVRSPAPTVQVFVRDQDSQTSIKQALGNLNVQDASFVSGNIETAISVLAQKPSPRLLIVDISDDADPVARVNALADVCEPNTGVIVIGNRNDIVLYRDLRNAGVSEYFFKPLVSNLVTQACSHVLSGVAEPRSARTGKLIFVIGVRGGVGATTIAVNTAWSLAETRQRWVMLLDLDLQGGDAALQLDETPSHALREALDHPERVDKLFLDRAVTPVERRIDLLAALEPLGETVTLIPAAVQTLLESLLNRYRFVFVDLPPSNAARLMQSIHIPAICVLVSAGTLASARDVARWREWLTANTPERTVLHVLNQHGAPDNLPDSEFVRAVGRAPDVIVPYDREIAATSILGIKEAQKCAALSRGLAPLLRHLSGDQVRMSRSLFKRIFG
ncbi:MAG TPA: AAA family ATPase [Pseudolabrys sp.]|nr:AAA family ATPase [Pseudolabrys sp.]HZT27008.1 AAA family ATPase [Pseudolabrys sp.]